MLESSIDLSDIVKKGERFWPHISDFDHQLVWVTPIKDYAEAIENARFILEYCIDDNFRNKVRKSENMPCVAVITAEEPDVFNYSEGRLTRYQGKTTPEMIVQRTTHYQTLKPNEQNLMRVMDVWDNQKAMDIPGFGQFVQEIQNRVGNSRINEYVDRYLSGSIRGRDAVKYLLETYQAESVFDMRQMKEKLLSSFLPAINTTNIIYERQNA